MKFLRCDPRRCLPQVGPGLIMVLGLSFVAYFIASHVPKLGSATTAILLGILVGNLFTTPRWAKVGISFASKSILSYSIMLMGFSLSWSTIDSLGAKAALGLIIAVLFGILFSRFIARPLKVSPSLGLLIGFGTSICGSSAVMASSPLVSEEKHEIGIAVSVVNLLGTVGIFVVPMLCIALELSVQQSSLVIGGSLQAVGHVAAAGQSLGLETAQLSMAIKMARISLLVPAILVLASVSRVRTLASKKSVQSRLAATFGSLPKYLFGFIGCSFIANMAPIPESFLAFADQTSSFLMLAAMTGIGLEISFKELKSSAPRALLLGTCAFAFQIGLMVLICKFKA